MGLKAGGRGGMKKKEKKKEEEEITPHMCESIGHRPFWVRCPKITYGNKNRSLKHHYGQRFPMPRHDPLKSTELLLAACHFSAALDCLGLLGRTLDWLILFTKSQRTDRLSQRLSIHKNNV